MIESYYRFVFTSAHYTFPLTKQTSLKLLPKIIYDQVHIGFTIDNNYYSIYDFTYPIRRNELLKIHYKRDKNSLGKSIQSYTKYHMEQALIRICNLSERGS